MSKRPTPETDDQPYIITLNYSGYQAPCVEIEYARKLERERDEALEALSDWENAALHVEADHPDEKHCGCVPILRKLLTEVREKYDNLATEHMLAVNKLCKERDDARNALSRIDEIFCDGEDTHDDWMKMGIIAKDYLKGLE